MKRIRKRGENYYYRIRIPQKLKKSECKLPDEIVVSLRTSNYHEAQYLIQKLNPIFNLYMAKLRDIHPDDALAVFEELKKVFKQRIETSILSKDQTVIDGMHQRLNVYLDNETKLKGWVSQQLDERLLARNVEFTPLTKENYIDPFDVDSLNQGDIQTELTCSQLFEQAVSFVKAECRKTIGREVTTNSEPSSSAPAPTEKEIITLRRVADSLKAEKISQSRWKGKTINENEASFELAIQFFGQVDISEITRDKCNEYLSILQKVPTNRNKKKEYVGKSIFELDRLNISAEKCLDAKTVNKRFNHFASLFTHAQRHGWTDRNPASGIHLKVKTKPNEERRVFSTDDLVILLKLAKDSLSNPKEPKYRYWVPLISLFGGLRQQEICQMRKDQVKQDSQTGLWYFNVEESDHLESVKNLNATRIVPINSALLDLGFLEYLKVCKHKRLWPELKYLEGHGYSKNVQRYFNYKWVKELPDSYKKSFHSLRHNFITQMEGEGFIEHRVKKIFGHGITGETRGRYTEYTLEKLTAEVEKLSYPPEVYKALGIDPR